MFNSLKADRRVATATHLTLEIGNTGSLLKEITMRAYRTIQSVVETALSPITWLLGCVALLLNSMVLGLARSLGAYGDLESLVSLVGFRSWRRRFRGALAFTLIELLVVISIIAILISITSVGQGPGTGQPGGVHGECARDHPINDNICTKQQRYIPSPEYPGHGRHHLPEYTGRTKSLSE